MSSVNKNIKIALKKVLVPYLAAEGFEGKFPAFMRLEDDTLHLLSVQFDKWGGGFFLEFAAHPAGDKTMSWGEVVPEAKLTVAHAALDARARLQETGSSNSTNEMWFRFEGLNQMECESLVKHVVEIFPQVNTWLRENEVGPNISTIEP